MGTLMAVSRQRKAPTSTLPSLTLLQPRANSSPVAVQSRLPLPQAMQLPARSPHMPPRMHPRMHPRMQTLHASITIRSVLSWRHKASAIRLSCESEVILWARRVARAVTTASL